MKKMKLLIIIVLITNSVGQVHVMGKVNDRFTRKPIKGANQMNIAPSAHR